METAIKVFLWVPAVVAIGVTIVVALLPTAMRTTGGGPRKGDMPGVMALGAIAIAAHAGYFLAPWWYGTSREVWAVVLMAPIALVALVVIGASRGMRRSLVLMPDGRSNRSAFYYLKRAVGILVIYVAPVVVMMAV